LSRSLENYLKVLDRLQAANATKPSGERLTPIRIFMILLRR